MSINTYRDIYIYIQLLLFAHGSSEHLAYSAIYTPSPPRPSLFEDYLFNCNTKNYNKREIYLSKVTSMTVC